MREALVLMALSRSRQRRARFEEIYAREYGAVCSFVFRRMGGDSASEVLDVVAEVFAVTWQKLDDAPPADAARPWLYTLAHYAILNHRRGRRRRSRLFDRLRFEAVAVVAPSTDASIGSDELAEAIRRLPHSQQEALQLVIWDGCTYAEAAQILGCSPTAVGLRLHKAKARLREDPAIARRFTEQPLGADRQLI